MADHQHYSRAFEVGTEPGHHFAELRIVQNPSVLGAELAFR